MNKLKRTGKIMVSVFLIAIMSLPSIPSYAVAVTDKNETNTGLGTGSIIDPIAPAVDSDPWRGNYVYYGNKIDGNYVRYRVLDKSATEFGGNTLFLDCDYAVEGRLFDDDSSIWADSDIRAYLNGDFLEEHFSSSEQAAIVASTKTEPSAKDGDSVTRVDLVPGPSGPIEVERDESIWTSLENGEKIFLLDLREAKNIYYGYVNENMLQGSSAACPCGSRVKKQIGTDNIAVWMLRSRCDVPGQDESYYFADGRGCLIIESEDAMRGVSPAFNLNLSTILFSTIISDNAGTVGAEYKLTIKDSDLSIQVTDGEIVSRENSEITVPYTVSAGTNRVSILITDGEYILGTDNPPAMKCYCELSIDNDSVGSSGTGTFTLPDSFDEKNDEVYIIAEKLSGNDKMTDYASEPVEIVIPAITSTDRTSNTLAANLSTASDTAIGAKKNEVEDIIPKEEKYINISDDYIDNLYSMLEDAIEAGGEQTIYWNQGTALPYDIMKLLEEHPNITLVFSYSYQGNDYKVSISGKNFKADPKIEWYGPVCLYSLFDGASISTSASANPTSLGNRTYTVISGDTLSKIAADLHVSVGELTRINNITNPNYIRIGQIIRY